MPNCYQHDFHVITVVVGMGSRHHRALDPSQQLPLHNKRVLVTAPRQYASKLVSLLVSAGSRPVWVPGVEICRLASPDHRLQFDAALLQLSSYSHLAFTSKNGILAVLERLTELQGGLEAAAAYIQESGIKLCALGADGEVLQEVGLQVDVSPAEASTKGLAAELAASGQAQGARVLCPVPHVTGGLIEPPVVPRFLAALERAGALPSRVPAYTTTVGLPSADCCSMEAQLLQDGHFDAIAFSSTAEAQGLCILLRGREAVARAVQKHGIILAAHGPYTAAGAAEVLKLAVPVVSQNFASFQGLVSALEAAFQ
eukprot:gene9061-9231_t